MKKSQRIRNIIKDDAAQAMTEYVIVIPAVLLMFFATIQTGVIIQSAQLANYAAFAAARSYATSYSKFKHENGGDADQAHDDARKRAKNAAALVMAPVSHAQNGEGLAIWQPIRDSVANFSPPLVQDAVAMVEGFLVASLYRIQGFTISRPASDASSTATVACSFEYWTPISVPGLVEIWNFMDRAGRGGEHRDTERMQDYFNIESPLLSSDLNDQINQALGILDGLGQWIPGIADVSDNIEDGLLDVFGIGFIGSPYNVHLQAKCRVGFEPWNGSPIVGPDEADCEAVVDQATQDCVDEYQLRQDEVAALQEEMDLICDLVPAARTEENQKEAALQACQADPNTSCATEQSEYNTARNDRIQKENACEVKTAEYDAARLELENSDAQDCLP